MARKGVPQIVDELRPDPETRVTSNAVYKWLRGATPRPAHAIALVAISDGELTLESIYKHTDQLAELCAVAASRDDKPAGGTP